MLRELAATTLAVPLLLAPVTPEPGAFAGARLEPGRSAQEAVSVRSGLYVVDLADSGEHYVNLERTIPGRRIWYGVSGLLPTLDDEASSLNVDSLAHGAGDSYVGNASNGLELLSSAIGESPLQSPQHSMGGSAQCRAADGVLLQMTQSDLAPGQYQLIAARVPADGVEVALAVATVTDFAPTDPDYTAEPPPPLLLVGGLLGVAVLFLVGGVLALTRRPGR